MKIYFAADHAGVRLKERLVAFVRDELLFEVEDLGAHEIDPRDDYPDLIRRAAQVVSENPTNRAIVLGGSGQGEAIVANRYRNVRAVVWYGGDIDIVRLSREHNDANILSLGARLMNEETAQEAVRAWLSTRFSGDERHVRRIQKIDDGPVHT
ncbi:ribose-5-phosphate isomerase [bacterium]|nr:ribose-5-phosphate isomerase [bacterium]|tara:strand:+ start:16632 stop:17090 length:459 start_codon:yes stop_codon:yes gene_type:complete